MVARSLLAHRLRLSLSTTSPRYVRCLTTQQKPIPENRDGALANDTPQTSSAPEPSHVEQPPPPPQTWLTRKIKEDPAARRVFFMLLNVLGYGSAKQYAGRRAFAMYTKLCIPRPDEESAFWKEGEHIVFYLSPLKCEEHPYYIRACSRRGGSTMSEE